MHPTSDWTNAQAEAAGPCPDTRAEAAGPCPDTRPGNYHWIYLWPLQATCACCCSRQHCLPAKARLVQVCQSPVPQPGAGAVAAVAHSSAGRQAFDRPSKGAATFAGVALLFSLLLGFVPYAVPEQAQAVRPCAGLAQTACIWGIVGQDAAQMATLAACLGRWGTSPGQQVSVPGTPLLLHLASSSAERYADFGLCQAALHAVLLPQSYYSAAVASSVTHLPAALAQGAA